MKTPVKTLIFTTILGSVVAIGCGEGTGEKIESQTDSITAKVENGIDRLGEKVDSMNIGERLGGDPDKDFLSDAVEANTKEIRLLTTAQQKGGKDMKAHATHMLADHKKLRQQVSDYITKNNISVDADTARNDDDLSSRQAGSDFDKAFADKMVADHEKTIRLFEDALDDVKDPALKSMIDKALPVLKSHLDMSREMQNKVNNQK